MGHGAGHRSWMDAGSPALSTKEALGNAHRHDRARACAHVDRLRRSVYVEIGRLIVMSSSRLISLLEIVAAVVRSGISFDLAGPR